MVFSMLGLEWQLNWIKLLETIIQSKRLKRCGRKKSMTFSFYFVCCHLNLEVVLWHLQKPFKIVSSECWFFRKYSYLLCILFGFWRNFGIDIRFWLDFFLEKVVVNRRSSVALFSTIFSNKYVNSKPNLYDINIYYVDCSPNLGRCPAQYRAK